MADLVLTAMLTPSNQVTYNTLDGTPYRGDDSNIAYVKPQHITELTARGFTSASASQIPAGDNTLYDTGWAVAT